MSDDQDERSSRAARENLKRALGELDRLADALSIPDGPVSTATRVYREVLQNSSDDRMYGWGIEDTATACLYVACKIDRVARNADDFVDASGTTQKQLLRRSKTIRSELDLDLEAFTDPTHYVEHYCDELGLDEPVEERAEQILAYATEAGITGGKSPQGQAAAAIYNAARESGVSVTQSEIASVADVTEVTIRNRYQEQGEVVRERERPPDEPDEVVDWFADVAGLEASITARAHEILECARAADEPIESESLRWALGAVQLASEEADEPVSKKTLKSVSGRSGTGIQDARNDLKSDLHASTEFTYRY